MSRLEAARIIDEARAKAEAALKDEGLSEKATDAFRSTTAFLEARSAIILLGTDRRGAAETTLERVTHVRLVADQ